jgi:hypothetical protein
LGSYPFGVRTPESDPPDAGNGVVGEMKADPAIEEVGAAAWYVVSSENGYCPARFVLTTLSRIPV